MSAPCKCPHITRAHCIAEDGQLTYSLKQSLKIEISSALSCLACRLTCQLPSSETYSWDRLVSLVRHNALTDVPLLESDDIGC